MDRRDALNKATITTSGVGTGLLSAERGRAFLRALKENGTLSQQMRQETRTSATGTIDKIATGARILRSATENADDGYRAGATFEQLSYTTRKVRLPWEITEDALHENLEGQNLEAILLDEMTQQFAIDLEDLEINGDTGNAGADAPFLTINDGILKLITTQAVSGRNIDGSAINAGVINKAHFFDALYAMPNKYRNSGRLRWIMSPARHIAWWEVLSDRSTAAGDALLEARGGAANGPLGIPVLEVPAMPDDTILLADPRNFVRVVSWQVRRRRITGETDAQLAALDKRFYIFFLKHDVVVEEFDAVVRIHTLDPV
jgi:HK97 family phage major capsid protein